MPRRRRLSRVASTLLAWSFLSQAATVADFVLPTQAAIDSKRASSNASPVGEVSATSTRPPSTRMRSASASSSSRPPATIQPTAQRSLAWPLSSSSDSSMISSASVTCMVHPP